MLFDRGPHVSFANCGLPYYVGNVIADERRLLVASRDLFRDRFNIDVRTEHEVTAIDRDAQTIHVKELRSGTEREERYVADKGKGGYLVSKNEYKDFEIRAEFGTRYQQRRLPSLFRSGPGWLRDLL